MSAFRRLFFFCRRPADYYLLSKKEPITTRNKSMCYRLCVFASGSLITDIFSCFTLINVSCLHLGQYRGKFFSSVSSRICNLVLFPQMGQSIHSVLFCISIRYLADNSVKIDKISIGIIPNSLKFGRVFYAACRNLIITT